jgi:hypothetical protein
MMASSIRSPQKGWPSIKYYPLCDNASTFFPSAEKMRYQGAINNRF